MAITGRLVLLAALLLPVTVLSPGWPTLLGLAALLLLAVVVDVALAADVRAVRLSRRGDSVLRLGETANVALLVGNPGARPFRGRVRDAWPPSAGAADQRHDLAIDAGSQAVVTTTLLPTRRGDRRAYAVTVRALGPLRLAGRQCTHRVPWTVRVLPPFTSRKHLPSRLARLRELDGRTAVLVRGQGTEFDSLREYVAGDDVRAIDWRASARAADLMIRTWRPERDRRILVVLDTGRTSAGRVGDAPRLDAAMDAALLLAALASRAGDRVDLLAYDRRVRASVQGASAATLLPALVEAMAPLEAELVETDARGLVSAVLARAPRRSLIVLLTTLDSAPLRAGLLPELGLLTRRHEVVLCAVADPRVETMRRGRGDAAAVYAAASAERDAYERRRTTEELRRRGVEVIDAPPESVAPRLADTYLALKAAGRL
jgi:uncharacterized protein (DUF58 family)